MGKDLRMKIILNAGKGEGEGLENGRVFAAQQIK